MEPIRFEALAEAYGGDLRRWPEAERDAASAFAERSPDLAAAILARADALDALLWEARSAAPSEALRARVIAAAPRTPVRGRVSDRARRWWAGIGVGGLLAASCAAGLAVGVAAAPAALAHADRIAAADPINEAARFLREPLDGSEG